MTMDINWIMWTEADVPQVPSQTPQAPEVTPLPDTTVPDDPAQQASFLGVNPSAPVPNGMAPEEAPSEPGTPDMPADYPQGTPTPSTQFEAWKREFYKIAIKGDPQEMLASIGKVRDLANLESPQRRFVDDNYSVLRFRQNPVIAEASKAVRKMVSESLDRNRPGSNLMQYIYSAVTDGKAPRLREVLAKMPAFHGVRHDLHRKFLAALSGSVLVGGGGSGPDLIYSGNDFSINLSTRASPEFGRIQLLDWSLQKRDPDLILSDSEREKLEDGSPEEKQVLRRRIVIESISRRLEGRAFLIHLVDQEGTCHYLGWDASEGLLSGYNEGKIVVRSKGPSDSEAMIDEQGDLVPVVNIDIFYLKDTGQTDASGRPKFREVPFISRIDGQLYLTAAKETFRDLATGMSGLFFQEDPWIGQPQELMTLQRSVPSLEEVLLRGPQ